MALNMLNTSMVMSIYSSILTNEYNWLLLHYIDNAYDELTLHSYGVEGLEELKTRLSDLHNVFIAFYREEVDVDAGYVIINYIPSSISEVKRARILVHSRCLGILFKKHQAIYTVDTLSLITTHNVHQAITDPDAASFPPNSHSPSQSADKPLPERKHNFNINPAPVYLHSALQPAIQESPNDPSGNKSYASHFSEPVSSRHSSSQLADKPLPEIEHNSNINFVPDHVRPGFQPAIQKSPNDPAGNNTTRKSSLDYTSHLPEATFLPLARHPSSQLVDKPLPEPLPERKDNFNINSVPFRLHSAFQPAIQESPNVPAGNNITRKPIDYTSHFPEAASLPLTRQSSSQLADKPLPEPKHNSNIKPVPRYVHSSFQPAIQESPNNSAGNNITRKSSLDYASRFPVVYATPHMNRLKGKSIFKLLSRRKYKKIDDFPWEIESSLPPQTPPKDSGNVSIQQMLVTRSDIGPPRMDKTLHHQRSRSMLDPPSVIFRAPDVDEDIIVAPENRPSHHLRGSAQFDPLLLQGKWARKGAISDPEERARQRINLQLQKEREEQALVKEEAERQRRLKLEKKKILQQEKEEEAQRLVEIEQEVSRIRLHRRRLEQAEKEEEERQRRKIEDRKKRDRKRRMEEHQRAEEWRKHKAEIMEAAAREAAEIQQRDEAKRRYKIQLAEAKVKQTKGEKDLTGWITLQSRDEVLWKRRYFKFVATTMLLYRCAEDMAAPLENIDLQGNVGGLKEWYEGCYEDLKTVAFSFVVEFKNGRVPMNMYADSEEEKYKLLGLLRVASEL